MIQIESPKQKPLPTSFLTWIEAFEHLMRRRFFWAGKRWRLALFTGHG